MSHSRTISIAEYSKSNFSRTTFVTYHQECWPTYDFPITDCVQFAFYAVNVCLYIYFLSGLIKYVSISKKYFYSIAEIFYCKRNNKLIALPDIPFSKILVKLKIIQFKVLMLCIFKTKYTILIFYKIIANIIRSLFKILIKKFICVFSFMHPNRLCIFESLSPTTATVRPDQPNRNN